MIKILLNNPATDFILTGSYSESIGESEDGMRGGTSYTVFTRTAFSFENEQRESAGYSYDLSVIKSTDDYAQDKDLTASPEEFKDNFHYIYDALRRSGLKILNYPAVMPVGGEFLDWVMTERFTTQPDENAVAVKFDGWVRLREPEDDVRTCSDLLAYLGEQDEHWQTLQVCRAIGDHMSFKRKTLVEANSISDELYGCTHYITLNKVSLPELLRSGISREEVGRVIVESISKARQDGMFYPLQAEGLENLILELYPDRPGKILKYCQQTVDNLDIFRKYCPQRINWRDVPLENMRDSDLDLMIQSGEYAYTSQQWEFIARCMAVPELEAKVVAHAYSLGHCSLGMIIRSLNSCTPVDLLRGICADIAQHDLSVSWSDVSDLLDLQYQGASQDDYAQVLATIPRFSYRSWGEWNQVAALTLKVGVAAGVPEGELAQTLQGLKFKDHTIELCDRNLRKVYQETGFAPGLAWVQAENERKEEEERRIAERRAKSNEDVVKFVRQSGKNAVCVLAEGLPMGDDGKAISRPDGTEIGDLKSDEQRVLLIAGRSYDYLVNVERARSPRNGILHIDIIDCDAGYVIGKKGANLEDVAKRLRALGCNVRTIRVHKHDQL